MSHQFAIISVHSFIQAISIAPLQVHYYTEALRTQCGYCVRISRRSATGNCEWRTFAQDPYVAARAGVEPMPHQTKGVDSTNAPPTPHSAYSTRTLRGRLPTLRGRHAVNKPLCQRVATHAWSIHSFILGTYIAPLQDTTTPRRSQPIHRQRRRTWRRCKI